MVLSGVTQFPSCANRGEADETLVHDPAIRLGPLDREDPSCRVESSAVVSRSIMVGRRGLSSRRLSWSMRFRPLCLQPEACFVY
jgi:hypothetical protein